MISANPSAKPNISFFNPIPKSNDLENFHKLPTGPIYKPYEFYPGRINKLIQKELSSVVKLIKEITPFY